MRFFTTRLHGVIEEEKDCAAAIPVKSNGAWMAELVDARDLKSLGP
jgi:hypothetical protein